MCACRPVKEGSGFCRLPSAPIKFYGRCGAPALLRPSASQSIIGSTSLVHHFLEVHVPFSEQKGACLPHSNSLRLTSACPCIAATYLAFVFSSSRTISFARRQEATVRPSHSGAAVAIDPWPYSNPNANQFRRRYHLKRCASASG